MFESYNFFIVSVCVVFAYSSTWVLNKRGVVTLMFHRKFWNFVLLFSFLVSGILGLLMAFAIDSGMSLAWYALVLWLHVEFGIVMAIVSIFHLLWHLRYYFPKKK